MLEKSIKDINNNNNNINMSTNLTNTQLSV